MERKFFGLTMADVMRLAYQLAGRKWLKNFLRHHPQISVRTPEGLSFSRAKGVTPESVAQFF